jgi:hypothetical protein
MKITFTRNVNCDFFDHKTQEEYPKFFQKWDSVQAEAVEKQGAMVHIALLSGDTIMNVPRGVVEIGA